MAVDSSRFLTVFDGIARVFPTRVGVNRAIQIPTEAARSFPHPRGGEPQTTEGGAAKLAVFPTRVGVNRIQTPPRLASYAFSPPAWG